MVDILQHELEVYSECGIPNYDVLRMATYFPAREYGLLDKYGTIAPGKIANLVLIDGDPKKNIKDIRKYISRSKKERYIRLKKFMQLMDGSTIIEPKAKDKHFFFSKQKKLKYVLIK